ncbi:MAG: MlaD family protein [Porphyromonas sp.]|nr:MlaD family protein [Porphyromonas sp.]
METLGKKKQLFRIGIAGIIALAILYFGLNFLKGLNIFNREHIYYTSLENAKDVTISTPILIDGYRVGLVTDVEYDYKNFSGTNVEMSIDKKLNIPKGSYIIVRGNPLSGAELIIIRSSNTNFHVPGESIGSKPTQDLLAQVSEELLPNLVRTVSKIDTLIAGVQDIIEKGNLPDTFREINTASHDISKAVRSLKHSIDAHLPGMMSDFRAGTASIASVTSKLDSLDYASTYAEIQSIAEQLNRLTQKLQQPDNTLGLLLTDRKLYEQINKLTLSADSLLVDIKAHPKRYVKFSLF